jgi:hypothetical protein
MASNLPKVRMADKWWSWGLNHGQFEAIALSLSFHYVFNECLQ